MFLWLPHYVKKLFKLCGSDIGVDSIVIENIDIFVTSGVNDCD